MICDNNKFIIKNHRVYPSICRVGYFKNQKTIDKFGQRLLAFRLTADLSQEQVHLATGIGQSHIAKTELGQVNTSISHLSLYAELFGIEDHELLDYNAAIPEEGTLKRNVAKFLRSRGFDPSLFLKQHQGATHIIEHKILETKFLTVPRFAREIVDYCQDKYEADFTTSQVSRVLDELYRKGVIEKLKTDKKTKFQYRKR